MAIAFNPTLDQFVNWANQGGIGKTDLVHAARDAGCGFSLRCRGWHCRACRGMAHETGEIGRMT